MVVAVVAVLVMVLVAAEAEEEVEGEFDLSFFVGSRNIVLVGGRIRG